MKDKKLTTEEIGKLVEELWKPVRVRQTEYPEYEEWMCENEAHRKYPPHFHKKGET